MHPEASKEQGLPLVVVVVLTWNDTELTTACLQSVFSSDYPNMKVVLVDNGSEPPRGPELQKRFPDVFLVQNEVNQGFSGGANRGLEMALELGADYIHLLGNDAIIAETTITRVAQALDQNANAGAASPLLLDPGAPEIVQFFTASLDRERTVHIHHHVGVPYQQGEWTTEECEFIPCVAVMFRSAALRQVGLFDESFGTCWEDYDLCLRLNDGGWGYLAVGSATATHLGSATTGKISPYIVYHSTRNRLTCIRRYAGSGAWRKHFVYYLRSHWHYVRQYGLMNWPAHLAFAKAFLHFLLNVRGEQTIAAQGEIPSEAG